ncbi:MAG: hypothetical protein Q8853_02650 [Candidatus Phytoplasma australasiaticum]|nr:hypothetical protein [Candidatus Phytoplasma australasiaticum]
MADEDISEWQEIPSPSSTTTNNKHNTTRITAVEITTLPLTESTIDNGEEKITEITTLPLAESSIDSNEEKVTEWLKKNLRELRSWVVQIGSKMRNYATGIGIFTCNTSRILTLVLVSLFCWMIQKKWRRQKQIDTSSSNKLMLLLQQKDQVFFLFPFTYLSKLPHFLSF